MRVHSLGLQILLLNLLCFEQVDLFPSAQKARGCWVEWLISDLQKDCIEIFAEDCKDCIEILRREIFCSFSFVLRSNLTLNASEHWGPGQIWIESSARASRKLRRRMSLLQKIWKFVHLYFHRREQTLNQQMKTCHLHWAQISKPRSHYLEICEAKGLR